MGRQHNTRHATASERIHGDQHTLRLAQDAVTSRARRQRHDRVSFLACVANVAGFHPCLMRASSPRNIGRVAGERMNKLAIVVRGNLSDGFTFVGPFDSFDDAAFSMEGNDGETWIATLESPKGK